MSLQSDISTIRSWYESRDRGDNCTKSPLLANVSCNSLRYSNKKSYKIESHMKALTTKLKNEQKDAVSIEYSYGTRSFMEDAILSSINNEIDNQIITNTISNNRILELANDLSCMTSIVPPDLSLLPTDYPIQNVVPPTITTNIPMTNKLSNYISDKEKRPLQNNSTSNERLVQENIKAIEQPTQVYQHDFKKFKSAKDQFKIEGGKIENLNTNNQTATAISKKIINSSKKDGNKEEIQLPPELEGCDPALVEKIEADIIHTGQPITFDDIAGLEFAKKCVNELICWPMTRPDLFQGLRALPRGLLLFGPPGTGKTLIGKAIANQAGATFFSISASSMTSKWIGESEKLVRTLFAVAVYREPSVVFIDEVDSLLCQRSSDENEASRRLKTEFLVQLDGAGTNLAARVVIVGATNRPDELDEAARRRFVKRIYIPLPDIEGRKQLFQSLLAKSYHKIDENNLNILIEKSSGFSGADVRSLCTEAAMGPVREIAMKQGNLLNIKESDVPPITMKHFDDSLEAVTTSVSPSDLKRYIEWNNIYGSFRKME
jgi:SpoVK/Ycf46/Vps4 family AAA+-type ATPase